MSIIYIILICSVLFVIGTMLLRLFQGPTVFDRMNALGVIGANAIVCLILFGFLDDRPDMYVDIGISYAMLGFVGSVIIAKFLGGKKL